MKKLLLILIGLSGLFLYPCSNEYEEIYGINRYDSEPDLFISDPYVSEGELYNYISVNNYLIETLEKEANDVAIAYLYIKKYKRALQITSALVKKFPNEYNVVITHAASLELNGKFSEALTYMKKALELKPDSHWNSEWIHVKILEARIAGQDLQGKSLLNLDFGNDSIPKFINQDYDIKILAEQLEYQIEDRMVFVDSTDALLGSMIFDFANLLYLNGDTISSKIHFELAKEKGFVHPMIDVRIKHIEDWDIRTSDNRHNKYADTYYNDYRDQLALTNRMIVLVISLVAIVASAIAFIFVLTRRKHV